MQFTYKGRINRTCSESFSDFHKYKPYLEKDFYNKCAYCDLRQDLITTPFEIDHFVPQAAFKGKRDELETDYNNLVLACKKCNNAKRSKFKGDINSTQVTNELFYDPVLVDYNEIFYRNELGEICSDDDKGISMILALKLYRPIHAQAWILENAKIAIQMLEKKISVEQNVNIVSKLQAAQDKLKSYCYDLFSIFIANYNIE